LPGREGHAAAARLGLLLRLSVRDAPPELVERVVGVDIGDAGSRQNRAELGARGMFMVLAYQIWLALAWRIGGRIGDAMARWMARAIGCPTDPRAIGSQMGYPYAMRWLGVAGGLERLKVFKPHCPMLYLYGERKPFMFHSRAWAESVAARAFPTGHWIMIERASEFNAAAGVARQTGGLAAKWFAAARSERERGAGLPGCRNVPTSTPNRRR
jgi:hypothetical protein